MKWTPVAAGFDLTFPIYHTNDFGKTWGISSFNGVNQFKFGTLIIGGGDPVIAFDADGKVYLSWLTFNLSILDAKFGITIHYAESEDNGATWILQEKSIAERALIDGGNIGEITTLVDKAWIVCDQSLSSPNTNNLYAIYAELNAADTTYKIEFSRKLPGVDTFELPIIITQPEIVFAQFSSIDVDNNGHIHILFSGAKEEESVLGLFYAQSVDGGLSFTVPKRITDVHIPNISPDQPEANILGVDEGRMYPCPQLRIDKSSNNTEGNLYITWTANGFAKQETEGLDIFFMRSTDNGMNWSNPQKVNDDINPISHQFFSSMAINNEGIITLGWYDRREDEENRFTNFYLAISRNGGLTFEENFAVSTTATDYSEIGKSNNAFGIGEYTQVAITSSMALPFWADGRSNDGNIDIYYANVMLDEGNISTSVDALQTQASISDLFQNPAIYLSSLHISLKKKSNIKIQLIGQAGQILNTITNNEYLAGEHKIDIPLNQLPFGAYMVAIHTQFGVFTRYLIHQE